MFGKKGWSAILASLVIGGSAQAYFSGRTVTDQAELKEDPDAASITVKVLPIGTPFNAQDNSTNGYYYIRTTGRSGWIPESCINHGTKASPPIPTPRPSPDPTQSTDAAAGSDPLKLR